MTPDAETRATRRARGHASGHAHTHSHAGAPDVTVGRWARILLVGFLVVAGVAATIGVIALWPAAEDIARVQDRGNFAVPGVTFPQGEVTAVESLCPATEPTEAGPSVGLPEPTLSAQGGCGGLQVRVLDGDDAGSSVRVEVAEQVLTAGTAVGDEVRLVRTPTEEGAPPSWSYWTTERGPTLGWLALVFAVVVVAVARLRGLMAMVGLVFSGFVILQFLLPAILTGGPGVLVTLSGTASIMFVVLFTTHGFSMRTCAALAGTLIGIGLTAAIGWYVIGSARLTGIQDDSGWFLASLVGDLNFQELLLCSLIIFGLGVLNDVTIAQASAVWELRAAVPDESRLEIFRSGMRIGRDHIASTIYTIVFAYVGAALFTLLLITVYDQSLLELLSTEEFALEVARTLASGIGLVLAVPVTTGIAAVVAAPRAA